MTEQVTARGVVYGRVQGVAFRYFTREQARQHKLTGYARNQADGSVAFALCGERSVVEAVLRALEVGPSLARVSRVDVSWEPAVEMSGFEIA